MVTDDLAELVRQAVRAELLEQRRMAAALEALTDEMAEMRRCLLDKRDRRAGLRLVPAVARLMGERPFSVAEVAALVLNDRSPAAGVVRDAMADHADADGGLRGFGRLLQRLQGVPLSGWRVQRVGGGRWRVTAGFSAE